MHTSRLTASIARAVAATIAIVLALPAVALAALEEKPAIDPNSFSTSHVSSMGFWIGMGIVGAIILFVLIVAVSSRS